MPVPSVGGERKKSRRAFKPRARSERASSTPARRSRRPRRSLLGGCCAKIDARMLCHGFMASSCVIRRLCHPPAIRNITVYAKPRKLLGLSACWHALELRPITGLTTIAPSRLHLRPRHTQQYTYIHIIVIIKNTERKGEEAQEQSGSGHWTPKRYGWTRDRREDDTCERHTDTQTHKTLGQPRALPHIVPHYATQGHAPNPVAPPAPTVPRAQTTAETTQTGDMG